MNKQNRRFLACAVALATSFAAVPGVSHAEVTAKPAGQAATAVAAESAGTASAPAANTSAPVEKTAETAAQQGNAQEDKRTADWSKNRPQEDAIEKLRNRAKEYVDDKQERLDDKAESRSTMQKVLLVLLKVLICLAVPVVGMFAVAFINSYLAIKIDLTFAGAFFFITAILIVNSDNPNLVMFYEWLKLALLCIIGLIACSFLNTIIKHFLGLVGVEGIDIEIPLKLAVVAGICKWGSRYIEKLVIARNAFSIMQFISIGLLLGQLSLQYFDHLGRISSLVGIVAIVAVILLSKAMILVRKSVRYSIIGIAAGVLFVCLVEPLLKMIL